MSFSVVKIHTTSEHLCISRIASEMKDCPVREKSLVIIIVSDPATIPATPAKSAPVAANGGSAHAPPATPFSGSSSSTSSKPAGSGRTRFYVLMKELAVYHLDDDLTFFGSSSKDHMLSL